MIAHPPIAIRCGSLSLLSLKLLLLLSILGAHQPQVPAVVVKRSSNTYFASECSIGPFFRAYLIFEWMITSLIFYFFGYFPCRDHPPIRLIPMLSSHRHTFLSKSLFCVCCVRQPIQLDTWTLLHCEKLAQERELVGWLEEYRFPFTDLDSVPSQPFLSLSFPFLGSIPSLHFLWPEPCVWVCVCWNRLFLLFFPPFFFVFGGTTARLLFLPCLYSPFFLPSLFLQTN